MTDSRALSDDATLLEQALFEVKKVIVGQDRLVERLIVALLARGHVLLEGLPGLAKTLAAETLATVVGGTFARIQFTPDLLPADITGTRIYRASTESFDVELGPVFVNLLLADEINRAPAKVQSALLEVMAEHQVSIGGTTYPVPEPFMVVATQNPIESDGVYPLPEAQRDRFLMKVVIDHPSPTEELEIVRRMGVDPPEATERVKLSDLARLQRAARTSVYVDRGVQEYAVDLVVATRDPARYGLSDLRPLLAYGASPRASLGLLAAARALALLRRRSYALPQDVFDVAPEVLGHRLVLSYEALAQGIEIDHVLNRLLATVPAARITPTQDATARPVPPAPNGNGAGMRPATGATGTAPAGASGAAGTSTSGYGRGAEAFGTGASGTSGAYGASAGGTNDAGGTTGTTGAYGATGTGGSNDAGASDSSGSGGASGTGGSTGVEPPS